MMPRIFYLTIPLLVIAGITGCTEMSTVQTGAYKYLYDYESHELHPQYVLYHDSEDSSTVFFRVRSSELLYARSGASSPFVVNLHVRSVISNVSGEIMDTIAFGITDAAKSGPGWLLGSFRVPLAIGNWNMLVELTDETKGLTQPAYLTADKTSTFTAQNYLVMYAQTEEPVFGGNALPGRELLIRSARNAASGKGPDVLHMANEVKLPPPPFSSNGPEIPDVATFREVEYSPRDANSVRFTALNGNYLVTGDPSRKEGITVRTYNAFYPEVKTFDALGGPLRYITTKSEHEEIVKNNFPKKMVDQFWLECAGNKEHARELIKIYYHRVEEANYYFSTFTEGWRTDRGMIHLVFGNPTRILKYDQSETWQYGEEGTAGMISFVFRKQSSPLSNNIYILDRDPGFKQYWERMVQTWRSGRVYSE